MRKKSSRKYTAKTAKSERSKRRRERRQMSKEKSRQKLREKLKWDYVGTFDGSLDKYLASHINQKMGARDFHLDKVHKVHSVAYYDYNDDDSLKRNFAKNGKLCRFIKVQPSAPNYDFKLLSCNA